MKSKKKKGAIRKAQVNDPQPDTDPIEAVQPEPEPFLERMYGSQSKWLIAFVLVFGACSYSSSCGASNSSISTIIAIFTAIRM